ncbi:YceI family protein [Microbacterium indicum]|uniref:YceI family protein n=1 Tax=Microbacterium indicum TaxID=358100 RepID=UPI00041BC93B|nr:YceI family protein [Microbacterium indicum]
MTDFDPSMAGTWTVDAAHSRFGFSAKHAMVTKVHGVFPAATGTLTIGNDGLASAHIDVALDVSSVDTRSADRDAHLRSSDFFDADAHPQITFVSTGFDQVAENAFLVMGDLTIKGTTKSVGIPLELTGVGRDQTGALRAGFEGTRRIDRREFGLEWQTALDSGGVLVSERVTLEFDISLVHEE